MLHHRRYFKHVKSTIKLQFYLGFVCVIVVAVSRKDLIEIVSSLIAMSLVIVPTLAYIKIAFAQGLVGHPKVVLARHQMAMLIKFVLTALLFALVYIFYRQCNFFVLLITYFICLFSKLLKIHFRRF